MPRVFNNNTITFLRLSREWEKWETNGKWFYRFTSEAQWPNKIQFNWGAFRFDVHFKTHLYRFDYYVYHSAKCTHFSHFGIRANPYFPFDSIHFDSKNIDFLCSPLWLCTQKILSRVANQIYFMILCHAQLWFVGKRIYAVRSFVRSSRRRKDVKSETFGTLEFIVVGRAASIGRCRI